jgi:hypothetical protein
MDLHPLGLRPTPADRRDFSRHQVFGSPALPDLPEEYSVGDYMEDQGPTDLCSAYSVAESEYESKGEVFSPEYQFAKTKQIANDPKSWGADLRQAVQVPCDYGLLPARMATMNWRKDGRDAVADWRNWPESADTLASRYKEGAYFRVDGPFDIFDNIRAALFQHKDEKRSVIVGTRWVWSYEYLGADGIAHVVPESVIALRSTSWHAWEIKGWKVIDGVTYLIGYSHVFGIGAGGRVYFDRENINKELSYPGAARFMFEKADAQLIKNLHLSNQDTMQIIRELVQRLKQLMQQIINLKH